MAVEFVCIAAGVMLGVQVSNWNDERRRQDGVKNVVGRLLPEFRESAAKAPRMVEYYRGRIELGQRAEKLWSVSGQDEEFVSAALLTGGYAFVLDFNENAHALRIGRDTIAQIDDDRLRNAIADVIEAQSDPYLRFSYIDSDFRRAVRRLVPSDAANQIADRCNTFKEARKIDRVILHGCKTGLSPDQIAQLARTIRADKALPGLLSEHINRLRALVSRVEQQPERLKAALDAMEADRDVVRGRTQ